MKASSISTTDGPSEGTPVPILYIVDARNRIERSLLHDWVQSAASPGEHWIDLTTSRTMNLSAVSALAGKLELPGERRIVPARVTWPLPTGRVNKPMSVRSLFFGDRRRPSLVRAFFTLRKDEQRAKIMLGEAATIDDLRQRFISYHGDDEVAVEELAAFILRQASIALDIAERKLHGSRYKVPRYVADSLVSGRRFRKAIKQLASEQDRPKNELYSDARRYMKELIAIPTAFYIDIRARLDEFLLSLGYENEIIYDKNELAVVGEIVRHKPTVILWTHKTHMDGPAVSRVFYQNDLPMPHMFGGINMSFAGAGFLFRRSGAIFIRRTFQNNLLYKLVLRHYISYLLEKRFPMTWAFEGTRSRLGKLMPPRFGLLKYVLGSAHASCIKDLHIIPVAISYDLIRDVDDYAAEQSGIVKAPESLKWAISYISSLRQPMGRIYMDFGEPVVLEESPDPDDAMQLARTAFDVAVNANRVTPLTMPSLVCFCLLGAAPRALTVEELQNSVLKLVDWASERGIRVTSDFDRDRVLHVRDLLYAMVDSGLLARYDEGSDVVYSIEANKQAIASYYRNSIAHHFVNKSIIELSLLKVIDQAGPAASASENFRKETGRLRDLFKFEFFYPSSEEFVTELAEELSKNGIDSGKIADLSNVGPNPTLLRMRPLVAHSTLLIYVEAYTVVLELLARLSSDQGMDEKTCVTNALKEGRQAFLQGRITSEASIGRMLFQNGYKLARHLELVDGGSEKVSTRRSELLLEFKKLSTRLDRIAVMSGQSRLS